MGPGSWMHRSDTLGQATADLLPPAHLSAHQECGQVESSGSRKPEFLPFGSAGFTSQGSTAVAQSGSPQPHAVRRGPGGQGSAPRTRLSVTEPGSYRSKLRCWAGTDGDGGRQHDSREHLRP